LFLLQINQLAHVHEQIGQVLLFAVLAPINSKDANGNSIQGRIECGTDGDYDYGGAKSLTIARELSAMCGLNMPAMFVVLTRS
jgi:hypothetical protein